MHKTYNVLILCTGNSARSIMAEAIFNTIGKERFHAYSAGNNPTGTVNPFAIELCNTLGYPSENLRSKSWDEFSLQGAPVMDFVITVCNVAGEEVCPIWSGAPITLHWGFEDPAAFRGTDEERRLMFRNIFNQMMSRIRLFISLPLDSLDTMSIRIAMEHELSSDET